ncbi:MAG: hypothetical protein HOI43_02175 [Gammaproteobacteria bacterium]|nr:hypothetical protein [Gammaproteobacteria bacterium]
MQTPDIQAIHSAKFSGVIALAGGGSQALADLLKQPGASSTILEAIVPYSNQAMVNYLGSTPVQVCSALTARQMAMQAFQHAGTLSSDAADSLFGLGLTAALATRPARKGSDRCHIALQTLTDTLEITIDFTLPASEQLRQQQEHICGTQVISMLSRLLDPKASVKALEESSSAYQASFHCTAGLPEWQSILTNKISCSTQIEPPGLIFPGAFNPVHKGHLEMKQLAEEMTGLSASFEISVTNVDKPPLDYREMENRSANLNRLGNLIFTRAATFTEKATIFPGATFIVGADTIKRIASITYYQLDSQRRDRAILEMVQLGVRFIVFGRSADGRFYTLEDLNLPADLKSICTQVPESSFREDISSTLLRLNQSISTNP